jgi:hypothetical protein
VEALTRVGAQVEAARLAVLRELDDRPDAVPGAARGRVGVEFLVRRLRVDPRTAFADVAAAHALDPTTGRLPEVGTALAGGLITAGHAGVCVRAAAQLPKRLTEITLPIDPGDDTGDDTDLAGPDADGAVSEGDAEGGVLTGMQVADRWLARQACRFGVGEVGRLARQLVARLAPDRAGRFDPTLICAAGCP